MINEEVRYFINEVCDGDSSDALAMLYDLKVAHLELIRSIYLTKSEPATIGFHKLIGSSNMLGLFSLARYYRYVGTVDCSYEKLIGQHDALLKKYEQELYDSKNTSSRG